MEEKELIDAKYEIVWITNAEELKKNKGLVKSFFSLYKHKSNFPDRNEREAPSFIIGRIREKSNDPYTHLMAFNLDGTFVAGCVVEFYPNSACVLVTYVFVEKLYRGLKIGSQQKKIAEILLKGEKGLKGLVDFFKKQYNKTPQAILFESNNPLETKKDSIPPAKRIKFFKSLGAKRVNFNYIQPPLEDNKGFVTNLFLLTFPDLAGLSGHIKVETIMSFVMELAKSLDRNKKDKSGTKYGLENYTHDLDLLQNQLRGINTISGSDFKGLKSDDRNILIETYENLYKNSNKKGNVDLVELPDFN